ncbi:alpha/beta fold hydrolase [Marinicella sp. S1101]|uniref:alpha/beta fold hydrolase n=1 Tax=Marinicella marina TaxID=2996016 RepID=UPI002260E9FF|nr:alpha/beta fold hydrolase [Marinicella marina]MCX7554596.1 alpha/beta fold hydrolase [Marinicella marina]MDJ1141020.1 alpha/beta fold hydrolase [Marinicella marina]
MISCQEYKIIVNRNEQSFDGTGEEATVSCCLWGNRTKPLVVVLGGVSANRWAIQSKNGSGWWQQVINHSAVLNPDDYSFLSIDYCVFTDENDGSNTVTTLDQARVIRAAQEQLHLPVFHAVIGASYGGMVALAFAAEYPNALQRLVCIAAADRSSVKNQAIRHIQRAIIKLGMSSSHPEKNNEHLALARALAVIGYRGEAEFEQRFQAQSAEDSLRNVASYVDHQGSKFRTQNPLRYLQLSYSIDVHQVDVSSIKAPTELIAISSDQLVPLWSMRALQHKLKCPNTLNTIDSQYGHDGFLLESEQLNQQFKAIFNSFKFEESHDITEPNNRCASGH